MNTPSAQGFACCSKFEFAGGILVRLCVWRRGGGVREFQDLVYMKGREGEREEEEGGRRGEGYWEGLFLQGCFWAWKGEGALRMIGKRGESGQEGGRPWCFPPPLGYAPVRHLQNVFPLFLKKI